MFPRKLVSLIGLFVVSLCMALNANAAIITFIGGDTGANDNNPFPNSIATAASFDSSASHIGAVKLINFESTPIGAFSTLTVAPGVTLAGAEFDNSNQQIVNGPVGFPDSEFGYNTTPGGSNFASVYGGTLTFEFVIPIDAFGVFISGVQRPSIASTITFSDGLSQSLGIPYLGPVVGGVEFIGFTDYGQKISSITINAPIDIVGSDDVRYVNASADPVPEPSTISLIGAGLAGLSLVRRRTKEEHAFQD